jgi:hypothetical protein
MKINTIEDVKECLSYFKLKGKVNFIYGQGLIIKIEDKGFFIMRKINKLKKCLSENLSSVINFTVSV